MNIFQKLFKKNQSDSSIEKKSFVYINSDDEKRSSFGLYSYNYFSSYNKKIYEKNSYVFNAVNLIVRAISSIQLIVMKKDGDKKHHVTDDFICNLIKRPNPFVSGIEFLESITHNLLIYGSAFILKIHNTKNEICEIYSLNPEKIELILDSGIISGYKYLKENGDVAEYKIDENGHSNIIHLRNCHSSEFNCGFSPIVSIYNAIEQYDLSIESNKSLLKNYVKPSGVLSLKNDTFLTDMQRNELKKELDYLFSGAKNSGRPILLEGGIEWRDLNHGSKEFDFSNADKIIAKHVANAFGVPVQMLNDSEHSSYNNYLESKRSFYENTVLPLLEKIISGLYNHWICYSFDCNYFVTYNEEDIPALSYKKGQLLDNLKNADFMTINEKRAVFGLSPIDGGDKL